MVVTAASESRHANTFNREPIIGVILTETRIRRLKCDESKPSCLRCLTGDFECEPSSTQRPSTNRHATSKSVTFELSRYCPSVTLQFQDETEAHYFSVFQSETSVELSGVFPSSFWNGIVLQESHSQPFVRHAVVSIAALNRSVKLLHPAASDEPPSLRDNYEASKQREYALKQYGKALKAMRGISWQERRHLRKVLISTLLVVVFEVMVAQPDMAFTHALIGDRLICNWLYDNPPSQSHTVGLASPISSVIEDELLLTFGRFDTQLLSFVDHRSLDIHQSGKYVSRSTISRMPTVFLDLSEAASYWQVVMRHAGHFLFSAAAATESFRFEKDFEESIAGRALEMNSSTSVYCSPYIIPPQLENEKATFVADVERWSAAFGPLWQQIQQDSMDLQENIAASILRMYSLNSKILLEGTTFTSELSYDIFLPSFQEIVTLARFIDTNLQPSYHFHLSTGPPLFVVLLRCRDPSVRREAISILRASNIDGPWNRHMIAKVGEWIMKVEEEGMNDLIGIEGAKRVRLTRLVMGMQEKKVLVQAVRTNPSNDGLERNLDWLEEAITSW